MSTISGFLIKSWLGRYVNIVVKYLYGSNPFTFAVSIVLYAFVFDSAPNTFVENSQFFPPVVMDESLLPLMSLSLGYIYYISIVSILLHDLEHT